MYIKKNYEWGVTPSGIGCLWQYNDIYKYIYMYVCVKNT